MLTVEQGSAERIVTKPTPASPKAPHRNPKPAVKKPTHAAIAVISEHGQGGGSSASDTGNKPNQQEAQIGYGAPTATQPTTAFLSEHRPGASTPKPSAAAPAKPETVAVAQTHQVRPSKAERKDTEPPSPARFDDNAKYAPTGSKRPNTTLSTTRPTKASARPTTAKPKPSVLDGLARLLPSVEVAFSKTAKVTTGSRQITITTRTSAEVMVVAEYGKSAVSVAVDPLKRKGSLSVSGHHVGLALDSILLKSQLQNKDVISQLARHAGVTASASHAIDLGKASVKVDGRRIAIPVTAEVTVAVSTPGKLEASVSVIVPIVDKHGFITTVETKVSVEGEVAIHPQRKSPFPDPIPAMYHQVAHVVETGLQALAEILKHATTPGGPPVPLPVPAAR